MTVPLLQAKTPCEIEGRNFKRHYTEPSIGKVYRLSFEVDKDVWDAFELVPRSAEIRGVLWWIQDGADFVPPEVKVDAPKPEKAAKGLYGKYWEAMVKRGIKFNPDLHDKLDCRDPDELWEKLHDAFSADSMSTVSPRLWEAWVTEQGLPESLITMSRNAEVKAVEETITR